MNAPGASSAVRPTIWHAAQESVWTAVAYGAAGLSGLWGVLKLWDSNRTRREMQRNQNDFESDNNALKSLTAQVASLTQRGDSQQLTIERMQGTIDRQADRIMDMGLKLARLPIVEEELIATRAELSETKADAEKQKILKHRYQNDFVAHEMRLRQMIEAVRTLDPAATVPEYTFEIDEEKVWEDIQNKRLEAEALRATKKGTIFGVNVIPPQ